MARRRIGWLAGAALLAATVLSGCDPQPTPLVVDSAGTAGDAAPGDGACAATGGGCTLRAAHQEANATARLDIVQIAPGVTPSLGGAQVPITAALDLRGGATLRDRIVHTAGPLTVRDLTIADVATSSGCGGAVNSTGTAVTLERVVVRDSTTAGNHGGGVCTSAPLTLIDTHVTGNETLGAASGLGGGVRTTAALLTLLRSTIDGNSTPGGLGTEVSVAGAGSLTVVLSTVVGDTDAASSLVAPTATGTVAASTLGPESPSRRPSPPGAPCCSPARPGGHRRSAATTAWAPAAAPPGPPTSPAEPSTGCGRPGPPPRPGRRVPPRPCSTPSRPAPRGCAPPARSTSAVGRGWSAPAATSARSSARPGSSPVPEDLDVPTAQAGIVNAVNPSGVAVGATPSFDWLPQYPPDAIRWSATGARTTLATAAIAHDIDDAGTVVGTRLTGPSTSVAVRWSPAGTGQDIAPLPGDTAASAAGIDDAGRIYGRSWSTTTASRAWWRPADLGPPTVLPSFGRAQAHVIDDDDHGRVLGRLTDADGSNEEAVVWDVVAGTATRLSGSYSAIDETAVYSAAGRNGVDLATGEVTTLPAPAGTSVSVVDVDGRGRALVAGGQHADSCAGCPPMSWAVQVVDVATQEVTAVDLDLIESRGAIGDGGHVIGTGVVGGVGTFLPAPYLARTTG